MRLDHLLLQWLSIDQALENLLSITKQPMSEGDLFDLCAEDYCTAYINAEGLEGKTEVATIDEVPQSVYGAGYQKIRNATALRKTSNKAPIRLTMSGPVFSGCWR